MPDIHSIMLSKKCSQAHPIFFEESNGHVFTDDTPLTPTAKNTILTHIVGILFTLLHSGILPMLTNPAFELALFNPRHAPDSNFWNKFASPIENTAVVNVCSLLFSE